MGMALLTLHIDFVGRFKGRLFFVLIDAHSKWPEIAEMKTIEVMRTLFGLYGIPEQVVSDNGPQFIYEFACDNQTPLEYSVPPFN